MHDCNQYVSVYGKKDQDLKVLLLWLRQVDLMESVFEAMPAAGLPPDRNTVYILVRAYVNTGQVDKAAALAARYKEMGVEVKPTGERLLELATVGRSNSSSPSSHDEGDMGGGESYGGEGAGAGNNKEEQQQH